MNITNVLHALGDPTRRAIVEQLGTGPRSVSHLAEPLNITLTAVAQHLQILQACGLVTTSKSGRTRNCRVNPAGFLLLGNWLSYQQSLWSRRLDRLGDILDEP